MLRKITFLMLLVAGFGLTNISAQTETPKTVAVGVVNGRAISLPKPEYPAAAQAVGASGAVNVQVTIDEIGNVIAAKAVSGHPLLRQAAENAAREAKFKPTLLSGQAVMVNGVIVYNFSGAKSDDSANAERPKGGFVIDPSANSNYSASQSVGTGSVRPPSGGVVNGAAKVLPKPAYPAAARAVNAEGAVNVQVLIDEEGNVASAQAVSGHPLLRQASEQAALGAKFKPTLLQGQAVKVSGIIVYNFVGPGPNWTNTGFSLGIAEKKGVGNSIDLPEEFSNERQQLNMLKQLSPEEQKAQITGLISRIETWNLSAAEMWRFKYGLAKGRILSNADDDNLILTNLVKLREMSANRPEGIRDYEFNRAVELAKFADKGILTKEDKDAIFSYLR